MPPRKTTQQRTDEEKTIVDLVQKKIPCRPLRLNIDDHKYCFKCNNYLRFIDNLRSYGLPRKIHKLGVPMPRSKGMQSLSPRFS